MPLFKFNMQVLQNFSLKKYNTFGIDVTSRYFLAFNSIEEITQLLDEKQLNKNHNKLLILGEGSNILFTKNFDGLVLKNEIEGIEIIKEDEKFVYIQVGAGENWHQFVLYCIKNNFGGVENLSLIPGSVGASPMQNIGAYGVELKDVFYNLNAFNIEEKKIVCFSTIDCAFGYRESIFKKQLKNQFIITTVTFKLNKKPKFNTSYGAIEQELEKMNVKKLSIKAISEAVINIRSSKLPNPTEIGNAGSFFKNLEVQKSTYDNLVSHFPNIVGYPLVNGNVKLAAGWLIEQCGFKGFRKGDAGCHAKQALVLVNYNNAKGEDILELSNDIIYSVNKKFGVLLEREVNIV